MIRRLFPYYGAKHAYSSAYPAPRHGLIVEPFAGSAAYSHRYGEDNEVILIEKNQRIAEIWRWLLTVSEDEFLSLPGVDTFEHIDQTGLPDGPAREYVRQWCADASPNGQNKVTSMMKYGIDSGQYKFTTKNQQRIMASIKKIRHWEIIAGGYETALDVRATWYIDPPYQFGGEHYSKNCKTRDLDFGALATWAKSRRGDVIVCEGNGANWMDFDFLRSARSPENSQGFGKENRQELIWYARDGVKIDGWNVGSFASPGQESLF